MAQKPLRRNENIIKFSTDHHSGLLFCWKIRAGLKCGIAPDRMIKYTLYFWQHLLQPHFREEEEILFALHQDKRVQKAIEDHTEIRQQMNELSEEKGNNPQEQLERLTDCIDNHVRYEERDLFPHLERILTALQWETIGRQLENARTLPLKDEFEDEFWVKGKTNQYSL